MERFTNIKVEELLDEFNCLGAQILGYHNIILGYTRQCDFDRAKYYLDKVDKCLARREEILITLYGKGTGIAV